MLRETFEKIMRDDQPSLQEKILKAVDADFEKFKVKVITLLVFKFKVHQKKSF